MKQLTPVDSDGQLRDRVSDDHVVAHHCCDNRHTQTSEGPRDAAHRLNILSNVTSTRKRGKQPTDRSSSAGVAMCYVLPVRG